MVFCRRRWVLPCRVRGRLLVASRGKAVAWMSAAVVVVLCLTGCSQKKLPTAHAGIVGSSTAASPTSSSAGPSGPAVVTISAAAGSVDVNPVVPIKVAVAGGSLDQVSLKNDSGTVVAGCAGRQPDLVVVHRTARLRQELLAQRDRGQRRGQGDHRLELVQHGRTPGC